jgi:hypothetical protein
MSPDNTDQNAGLQSVDSASFGPIACVTVTAPDLGAVESCYTEYLDYEVVGRGRVGPERANLWGCSAVADSRCLLLSPLAGDDCVLRFIEAPETPDYTPFASFGWNAAEILVRNVDALAERLADSPFDIVGAPANLSFTDDIRAMQVLGPGRELLYLTEIKQPIPGLDTPLARCDVDRVFIVILGGPSMADLQAFYADQFAVPGAPVMESRVKGMSAAFGVSPETKYPIAALPLAGQALIEVDEMPAGARARQSADDLLPPGIAMVSFAARGPGANKATRIVHADAPYKNSGRVSCRRGAAGELIEVLFSD